MRATPLFASNAEALNIFMEQWKKCVKVINRYDKLTDMMLHIMGCTSLVCHGFNFCIDLVKSKQ